MKKCIILALLFPVLYAGAQNVSNKISFPKGKKLEVTTETNSTVTMEMGGQSMESKTTATLTRILDIEDVSNGTATIEHKVKRLKMAMNSPMTGDQTFDSENEADMKGEGGKAMEKSLKNKYEMKVDEKGMVMEVTPDDDNQNPDSSDAQAFATAVEEMTDGMELPVAGRASEFKFLPDHSVSKGHSWTDSSQNAKTSYTLVDITDQTIVLNYTGESTIQKKQEVRGMEFSMNSTMKSSGTIILDKATGLLKERTHLEESDGTMEMMGQKIPMKTSAKKVTRVELQ